MTSKDANINKTKKHKEVSQKRREYIGYASGVTGLIIILVQYYGQEVLGFTAWKNIGIYIVSVALFITMIVFIRSSIARLIFIVARWLYEKLQPSVGQEFEEMSRDTSHQNSQENPDYKLKGSILEKEGYPHVSVRIETIQIVLENLLSNDEKMGDERLRDVGRKVGKNFIIKTWRPMYEHVTAKQHHEMSSADIQKQMQDRIQKWADMEKTAGWGAFQINNIHYSPQKLLGTITIVDSFLVANRTKDDRRLCAFLEGYMEEIIFGLTEIKVQVHEIDCGRHHTINKNCIFRLE